MTKNRLDGAPTRTCVGCGNRDRQSAMLRLRRSPDGAIGDADVRTGRSAYVHAADSCVRGILRSKVIGKSLRTNVTKDTRLELIETIGTWIAARAANGGTGN